MSIRKWTSFVVSMTCAAALASPLWAATPTPKPVAIQARTAPAAVSVPIHDGWPDTREGAIGRGWVQAFNAGEAQMREFSKHNLTPEALGQRSIGERTINYRKLKERFGRLTLANIENQDPGALQVNLYDSNMSKHKFTFEVQTTAPFQLASVKMTDHMMGMHGWFGH